MTIIPFKELQAKKEEVEQNPYADDDYFLARLRDALMKIQKRHPERLPLVLAALRSGTQETPQRVFFNCYTQPEE